MDRALARRTPRDGQRAPACAAPRGCRISGAAFTIGAIAAHPTSPSMAASPNTKSGPTTSHALLARLDALPAVIGGGSSGCRLAPLFAPKYPDAVRALLLWRITGGPFAAETAGASILRPVHRASATRAACRRSRRANTSATASSQTRKTAIALSALDAQAFVARDEALARPISRRAPTCR